MLTSNGNTLKEGCRDFLVITCVCSSAIFHMKVNKTRALASTGAKRNASGSACVVRFWIQALNYAWAGLSVPNWWEGRGVCSRAFVLYVINSVSFFERVRCSLKVYSASGASYERTAPLKSNIFMKKCPSSYLCKQMLTFLLVCTDSPLWKKCEMIVKKHNRKR